MKDCTKLFCDLISFGTQLAKHDASIEKMMSCLASIYLANDCCAAKIDYDAIQSHILSVKAALQGADLDIDNVRERLVSGKPVNIQDIIEFHGRLTVKLNDGQTLSYQTSEITHY